MARRKNLRSQTATTCARLCVCVHLCALVRLLALITVVSLLTATMFAARGAVAHDSELVEAVQRQMVVRLRSFVPGASGRVVIEPTDAGGRVRVLASRLPAPAAVAPDARAFVVWATGGEVRRVGELHRDARGDAAFEFAHPTGFETYSLVVTAERDARTIRPAGAFVFSTRAGEVAAFYPPKPEPRTSANNSARPTASEPAMRSRTVSRARENNIAVENSAKRETSKPTATLPIASTTTTTSRAPSSPTTTARASSSVNTRASSSPSLSMNTRAPMSSSSAGASEFYESVDSAVGDPASARTLTLAGAGGARHARGEASVATREGTAYVRVRFNRMPSPYRYGARRYVMWAQVPEEDRTLFLRALPARRLNRRTIYARRRNVASNDFNLSVTAERRSPLARPRGRRVLTTLGTRGGK